MGFSGSTEPVSKESSPHPTFHHRVSPASSSLPPQARWQWIQFLSTPESPTPRSQRAGGANGHKTMSDHRGTCQGSLWPGSWQKAAARPTGRGLLGSALPWLPRRAGASHAPWVPGLLHPQMETGWQAGAAIWTGCVQGLSAAH